MDKMYGKEIEYLWVKENKAIGIINFAKLFQNFIDDTMI